ncbi:MAG TPA: TMEM175 family protein [Rhodanobacteraceae bacterium]|nr:TMEM175 family protein [Rhodanobacteraceae bacterium]
MLYYPSMLESTSLTAAEARHERTESARLDNFVDGAFAFAITLLVISGASLPKDIAALEHALRGIPAFAACFAQLAIFWHGHVRWRDSARLTDRTSLLLSLLLVFFALIFVFPLHLVYASFFSAITHGWLSPDFAFASVKLPALTALFACYGLSYACMAGALALLFRHGARNGNLMQANAIPVHVSMASWAYYAGIGLFSALIALLAYTTSAEWLIAVAGFSYALLGFTGRIANRYRAHMERGAVP